MNYSVHDPRNGERVFTITDLSLVSTTTKTGNVATIPLRDIKRIHIYKNRAVGYIVVSSRENSFKISSHSAFGAGRFREQTDEYRRFLLEVHRKVSAANDKVRFRVGSRTLLISGAVIVGIGVLGIAIGTIQGMRTSSMVMLGAIGTAVMILGATKSYKPEKLPDRFLP